MMDQNVAGAVARPVTCTCCSRRGVRKMIRLSAEKPVYVAVCPACDVHGADGDEGLLGTHDPRSGS